MPAQPSYFREEMVPAAVPIWREYFTGVDWLALHYSPVYFGLGVPRGDGAPVVLVPGFLADDLSLTELYFWLKRMGYRPYMSSIGRNADCLDILADRLLLTVEKAYAQTGRKVHLIGHSLGGVLSRVVAEQKPQRVASVITLGSPFRGISSHPLVLQASKAVQERLQRTRNRPACFTGECNCPAAAAIKKNIEKIVPCTAIYTKTDGIVDWRNCINDDPQTNFQVLGTHVGLAFNPLVYHLIGLRLAAANSRAKREQYKLAS